MKIVFNRIITEHTSLDTGGLMRLLEKIMNILDLVVRRCVVIEYADEY